MNKKNNEKESKHEIKLRIPLSTIELYRFFIQTQHEDKLILNRKMSYEKLVSKHFCRIFFACLRLNFILSTFYLSCLSPSKLWSGWRWVMFRLCCAWWYHAQINKFYKFERQFIACVCCKNKRIRMRLGLAVCCHADCHFVGVECNQIKTKRWKQWTQQKIVQCIGRCVCGRIVCALHVIKDNKANEWRCFLLNVMDFILCFLSTFHVFEINYDFAKRNSKFQWN